MLSKHKMQLYLFTMVCSGFCSAPGSCAWLAICGSERSSLGEAVIVGGQTGAILVETGACSAGVLDTRLGCRNWCQVEAINTDSGFILMRITFLSTMQGCPSWGKEMLIAFFSFGYSLNISIKSLKDCKNCNIKILSYWLGMSHRLSCEGGPGCLFYSWKQWCPGSGDNCKCYSSMN